MTNTLHNTQWYKDKLELSKQNQQGAKEFEMSLSSFMRLPITQVQSIKEAAKNQKTTPKEIMLQMGLRFDKEENE